MKLITVLFGILMLVACGSTPVQNLMTASHILEANERLTVAIQDVSRVVTDDTEKDQVRRIRMAREKLLVLIYGEDSRGDKFTDEDKVLILSNLQFTYIQSKDDYLALKKHLAERTQEFTGVQLYNLKRLDHALTSLDAKLTKMTLDEKWADRTLLVQEALDIMTSTLYVLKSTR